MKRVILFITLTLVLVSCETRSGYFKIDGRFLNLNQGEFYVYSPDGIINGIDTIKVNGGRFTYETPCEKEGTLILIFANYSEQPVFAEPGKTADIKADASHLKEMEVKGTTSNKLMTDFRKQIANTSPPEAAKYASQFVKDNPKSIVSMYILRRYFLQGSTANPAEASALADIMLKEQPDNIRLKKLKNDIDRIKTGTTGNNIPSFAGTDINGNTVRNSEIHGKVAVIYTWASWGYESTNIIKQLKTLKNEAGNKLAIIGISLDANVEDSKRIIRRDSVQWPNICEGQLFESPIIKKLGMQTVPDNIVINPQGKIVARGLAAEDLKKQIEKLLK